MSNSANSGARRDIAIMDGLAALPRRSGELVFHDDWERRAFAIAVSLCESGLYDWDTFRTQLIAEIDQARETREASDPSAPGYYEHWLAALEKVLARHGLGITAPAPGTAAR
ncbi:MAG: nitrile hydratase accessory protein [Gammaproteobacteria bacterium]